MRALANAKAFVAPQSDMATPQTAAGAATMQGEPGWGFLITLAVLTFVGPLSVHAFLPVLPAITAVFGTTKATAGLTFSAALLVMAFATLVYGSLSDRYGRRPVLLGGLLLFVFGGALA